METVNFNYPSSLMEAIRVFSDPKVCLKLLPEPSGAKGSGVPALRFQAAFVSQNPADVEVPGLQKAVLG